MSKIEDSPGPGEPTVREHRSAKNRKRSLKRPGVNGLSKQKSPKQALSRTDLQCRVFQTPTFSITESKMIFINTNGKRKKNRKRG